MAVDFTTTALAHISLCVCDMRDTYLREITEKEKNSLYWLLDEDKE